MSICIRGVKAPLTSYRVAFRVKILKQLKHSMIALLRQKAMIMDHHDLRLEYIKSYYACFVIDPNGHNIEAMINPNEPKR